MDTAEEVKGYFMQSWRPRSNAILQTIPKLGFPQGTRSYCGPLDCQGYESAILELARQFG